MNTVESGTCSICGKQVTVSRTYYHYFIPCEWCGGGRHFEIVYTCSACQPSPPKRISVVLKPAASEPKVERPREVEEFFRTTLPGNGYCVKIETAPIKKYILSLEALAQRKEGV